MHRPQPFAAALLLALAAACSSGEEARVRLDVSALQRAAAQARMELRRIRLEVSGPGLESIGLEVPIDTLSFELEVASGLERRFEISGTGLTAELEERLILWGETIADLPPATTIDLVLPVFPAGTVHGVITALGGELPADHTVRFVNGSPENGRPGTRSVSAPGGAFALALPTGTYVVEAEAPGLPAVGQEPLGVAQGASIELAIVLAPPGYCAPEAGLIADADNDGDSCDVDCNDGDPALTLADRDGDGYSTCAGDCDDDSAAMTPADGDGDGLSTCAGDCSDTSAECTSGCSDVDADAVWDCADGCIDADGDGVGQVAGGTGCLSADIDSDDGNFASCADKDGDGCDDCSRTLPGSSGPQPNDDGPDFDGDGSCNAGDADDDGDGALDPSDPYDADPLRCGSGDGDSCDDCSLGFGMQPNNDGADFDGDGRCDLSDPDDDNDAVPDPLDGAPFDASSCRDADGDGCDDCALGGGARPASDGADLDLDGLCDAGDPDDDDDGVVDGVDPNPQDASLCGNGDGDACDDCATVPGLRDPLNDGPDADGDGDCDQSDPDDDNDGVPDLSDPSPADPSVCGNSDADGCDDCALTGGPASPSNDGPDFDGDGSCDLSDADDDNDGVFDAQDPNDANRAVCGSGDGDSCDDCSVTLGPPDPANDGPDFDGDGACNSSDPDDDGDGVLDPADPNDANPLACGSTDGDSCDDCSAGLGRQPTNDGPDGDADGQCDASDPDDDNDTVADGFDPDPSNNVVCGDSDADSCDDCTLSPGLPNAAMDGADFDGDGACDAGDGDDDDDTVADWADPQALDPSLCGSADGDGCDDCALTPGAPSTVNDGPDFDADGNCDASDADDDGDTVPDVSDTQPLDRRLCANADGDVCDDCVITAGPPNPNNDGPDFDGDAHCNLSDPDDDNDGVLDAFDPNDASAAACGDSDGDSCDDCVIGVDGVGSLPDQTPANDGPDVDGDGLCNSGDPDDDNDGVLDAPDPNDGSPTICGDVDGDGCDDCAIGVDGFGPGGDSSVTNDGPDADGDFVCDAGDGDIDNDGVSNAFDPWVADPNACGDVDGDGCDDCSVGADDFGPAGDSFPGNDGPDADADGACDAGDGDIDNDGVSNAFDPWVADPNACGDVDGDSCDDCSVGSDDFGPVGDSFPGNDGPDFDADGQCDLGDSDDDNDTVADAFDLNGFDDLVCANADGDGCDDCAVTSGPPNPNNDGADFDFDSQCDLSDPDDDNDGVNDGFDPNDTSPFACGDSDGDTCDDCVTGVDGVGPMSDQTPANDGPDADGDALCDSGDGDDDNDGVPDAADPNDGSPSVCGDVDADGCDDCSVGTDGFGPAADNSTSTDGPDADGDTLCDTGDGDLDNDGVANGADPNGYDPNVCGDTDFDGCDDCSVGSDDFGPAPDAFPSNDGLDTDGDGACNIGDADVDNDGVSNASDSLPMDPNVCGDSDADVCDDCSVGTDDFGPASDRLPGNDGSDFDADGQCDFGDPDDDNDGVGDGTDPSDFDPAWCGSSDGDGCDDCQGTGAYDPTRDGPDFDGDNQCDASDPDDDGDTVTDGSDVERRYRYRCTDGDLDGCDDCAATGGPPNSFNDGPDADADGACDLGDADDDNDGVPDYSDNCQQVPNAPQSDSDQDGFGDSCDCDPFASSCTTDCWSDVDGDTNKDCLDRCLDGADADSLGFDNSGSVVGRGHSSVATCTNDGTNPCPLLTAACSGADADEDLDLDGTFDAFDACLDQDGDGAGLDGGPPFKPNLRLDTASGGERSRPDVVVASPALLAVWTDSRQGNDDVWFAKSSDGGGTWMNETSVTGPQPNVQTAAKLGVDGTGAIYVVWQDNSGGVDFEIRIRKSTDGGNSWSAPQPVATAGGASNTDPVLLVGPDNRLYVGYMRGPIGNRDVWVATSGDGGMIWNNYRINDVTTDEQIDVSLALDGAGQLHAVWADRRAASYYDLFHATSSNQGASWSASSVVSDTGGIGDQKAPRLHYRTGALLVAFEDYRLGPSDIRAARRVDGTWEPSLIVTGTAGDEVGPDLAYDAVGGTYWLVYTAINGPNTDVEAARGLYDGKHWIAGQKVLDDPTSTQEQPAAACDAAGNVVALWRDLRGTPTAIFRSGAGQGCPKGWDCNPSNPTCAGDCTDQDSDGACSEFDCNDEDWTSRPGAAETCDLRDNDCDGQVDEGVGTTLLAQNMEGGPAGWFSTGDWSAVAASYWGFSGPYSFGSTFMGTDGNRGASNQFEDSALTSPSFTTWGWSKVAVSFDSYSFNSGSGGCSTDLESFEVSTNGSAYQSMALCPDPQLHEPYSGVVQTVWYDLHDSSLSSSVSVRFRFMTGDSMGNGQDDGWYVDNVRVYSCTP